MNILLAWLFLRFFAFSSLFNQVFFYYIYTLSLFLDRFDDYYPSTGCSFMTYLICPFAGLLLGLAALLGLTINRYGFVAPCLEWAEDENTGPNACWIDRLGIQGKAGFFASSFSSLKSLLSIKIYICCPIMASTVLIACN
ncbi:MAG: hypothetical protein HGB00_01945 [Chlorobiaceae bacterium]|nr:hypothetical protein [Chlorobiaceae bacterium]